jgi:hypothetical protein
MYRQRSWLTNQIMTSTNADADSDRCAQNSSATNYNTDIALDMAPSGWLI